MTVTPIQLLRSSTPYKRPLADSLLEGQLALNFSPEEPGLFFTNSEGSELVKIGPCSIGEDPPNSVPAPGGEVGNAKGEFWFNSDNETLYVWDGSDWKECGGGGGGGGGVSIVTGTAPIVSSGGTSPAISITAATTSAAGSMSAADKTKLDGIEAGAQVNVPTNLSYTSSSRLLASSTGSDVTLPLFTNLSAGLTPSSGGGTSNFLRADGTWATPTGTGVTSVAGTAPIVSSGGTTPTISISAASTSAAGSMSAADKTKLNGIEAGAQVNVPTNLSYTGSTRLLSSSTGSDVTLPLFDNTTAGLTPSSGGGTANFLRADGTWSAPSASLSVQTFTHTTNFLDPEEFLDFEMEIGKVYQILTIETSNPAWLRVYGTSSGRAADSRTTPGAPFPESGSGYFAEVITTSLNLSLFMSPIPSVHQQTTETYFAIQNNDDSAAEIEVTITAVVLVA